MAEKIICVVGPTACGKTKLGVLLAKRYDGEVVSADSMQIYKGMTIGTAAPTAEEMEGVPHHMIAVADPAEQWSAARYARAAVPIVDDILRRGKRPILVGGTGLWLDAVVQGRTFAGGHAGGAVRRELQAQLAREGIRPQVICVDPPRKGLAPEVPAILAGMAPERIVYVSCDPATLARDVKRLAELGYRTVRAQGVDLFPRTAHVETVVLLSKGEVDSKKIRVEFSLEDMDMSEFQDGATYTQIKDYVLEHSGLKVSNLYISQIKRKCGIEVGKNYNLPKSEDSRQPQCPPEKEKAIREAMKYFGMI